MLNIIKRWNRGVILAIIATMGLTGFIIYDEVSFQLGVSSMRTQINEHLEELAELSVLKSEFIDKDNKTLTQAGNEELKKRYRDFIDETMIHVPDNAENPYGWSTKTKSEFLNLANIFDDNNGYVTNYNTKATRVDIQKVGPGLANITINYELIIETKGGVTAALLPTGARLLDYNDTINDDYYYYDNKPHIPGSLDKEDDYDLDLLFKIEGYMDIKAKKVGGEWKFYESYGWEDFNRPTVLAGTPPIRDKDNNNNNNDNNDNQDPEGGEGSSV